MKKKNKKKNQQKNTEPALTCLEQQVAHVNNRTSFVSCHDRSSFVCPLYQTVAVQWGVSNRKTVIL